MTDDKNEVARLAILEGESAIQEFTRRVARSLTPHLIDLGMRAVVKVDVSCVILKSVAGAATCLGQAEYSSKSVIANEKPN